MWTPPERIRHPLPPERWPDESEAAGAKLFQPLSFGNLSLESRTWVPAMVPWRATEDGVVTRSVLDWYRRFASGAPAAIVVEATGIRDVPSGPLLRIGDDRFLTGLASLVEVVREASGGRTRLFIQLIDFLSIRRRPPKEKYLRRFLQLLPDHRSRIVARLGIDSSSPDEPHHAGPLDEEAMRDWLVSAPRDDLEAVLSRRELEALDFGARERVTDVDKDHIRTLPETLPPLFAEAGRRAREAGFDGVELHYAHAYTMASFLSALNDRQDGYGGSRANRVRLAREVYRAVREAVGSDYVVGCRMLGDEVIAGGSTIDDAVEYARNFAADGMDFLSISKGGKFEDAAQPRVGEAAYPYTGRSGYECMPTVYSDARGPFGRNAWLGGRIRQAIRADGLETPVVVSGGIGSFSLAERLLRDGVADVIGAARQSLADPDWFEKVRLGRGEDVRRCEYTNYCEALDQRHVPVTCKLWDRLGLDDPAVSRDATGKRRLTAPRWSKE